MAHIKQERNGQQIGEKPSFYLLQFSYHRGQFQFPKSQPMWCDSFRERIEESEMSLKGTSGTPTGSNASAISKLQSATQKRPTNLHRAPEVKKNRVNYTITDS